MPIGPPPFTLEIVSSDKKPRKRTRSSGDGTITARPDGRYRAYLRWADAEGKQVNKTRICAKFRDAQEALTEFKELRDRGGEIEVASTVSDLLARWAAHKASQVAAGTLVQYGFAIVHLNGETEREFEERKKRSKKEVRTYGPGVGKIKLADLRPEMIDELLRERLEAGLSPRCVKLLRTVLSMALDQAVRWRLVSANPARYSSAIKQPQRHGRSLTADQVRAFLVACKSDRLGSLWVVLLSLGLRRGEAIALTWGDCDQKARTLSVTKARKKEGSKVVMGSLKTDSSRRVIPLPSVCL